MQKLQYGYRGMAFLIGLNLDRMLWPAAIAAALVGAHYLGSL
ncbi:hypothetical protein [Brevirhabdus sp.]